MNTEIEIMPECPGEKMDPKVWQDFQEKWRKEVFPKILELGRKLAKCQPNPFGGRVLV